MALSRSMKNLMHDSAMARRGGGTHNPNGGGRSGMMGRALQQARGQYDPGGNRGRMPGGNRGPVLSELPGTQGRFSKGMQKLGQQGGGGIANIIRGAGGRNPRTGGPGLPTSAGGGFLGKRNATSGGVSLPPRASRASGMEQQQAMVKAKMQQQQQRGAGGGMMRPAVQPPQRGPGTVAGKPMPGGGTFGFASRGGGGTPALQQATAGARTQVMRQAAAPRPAGAVPGGVAGAQQRARAAGPAALAKPRGQDIARRIGGRQGPPARRGGMARALGSGGSRRRMLR